MTLRFFVAPTFDRSIQRAILLELYNATGGAGWVANDGWDTQAADECRWHGVHGRAEESFFGVRRETTHYSDHSSARVQK